MKIAIVSDTHDNSKNFNKAINFCNSQHIEVMLHCGDICNQDTIVEAQQQFKGKMYFVRGNGDFELRQVPEMMEITLGGKKIFFNHYPEISKQAAESGKYDIAFYGHTHRPWEETIGSCRLVNPGELAGQRYKPCFALYDTQTNKLELKILEML
jgi:uncharacterized protein